MNVLQEHVTKVFKQLDPTEAVRLCAFVLTKAHFKLVISLMWAGTLNDYMSVNMSDPFASGLCGADKQREINNDVSTMAEGEM